LRREDRKVESKKEIVKIIKKAEVLRVAFSENDKPYIVPVNFGYSNDTFYFHCASEGKKLDLIKNNSSVAFELEGAVHLIKGKIPCEFTMSYESVMGSGIASIIYDTEEKIKGMNQVMKQYTNENDFEYNEKMLNRITIVKIDVKEISGKQSK